MSSLSPKDRSRSPRFPNQSLEESLKHARLIYEGVHRSTIDSETAFKLMGFVGKTGTSSKALGSLRQYGLIEGTGENTRISDLSLAILEPESESERATSIFRAARSPDVFESILARFADRIPLADEPIRAFLIRDLGFQKNSADECIKSLRQSLAYAESLISSTKAESEHSIDEVETETLPTPPMASTRVVEASPPLIAPTQSANIPLTRECRAELNIYGPLTEKAVSNLIRHIQLLSEVWAED